MATDMQVDCGKSILILYPLLASFLLGTCGKGEQSWSDPRSATPRTTSTQERMLPGGVRLSELFDKGQLLGRDLTLGKRKQYVLFFETGKIARRGQEALFQWKSRYGPEDGWGAFGKWYAFRPDGALHGVWCSDSNIEDNMVENQDCGYSVDFKPDGTALKPVKAKAKCTRGCGEFRPLIEPGPYRVVASSLRVRAKPTSASKALFALKENDRIEVTEDTHKIETHGEETAPWVKIKTADGKTGYAFGGFIRKPDEFYIDMSPEGLKKLERQIGGKSQ